MFRSSCQVRYSGEYLLFPLSVEMIQTYKVITLNVNGLHNPIKRNKTIAKMQREKQDIIFWQERDLKICIIYPLKEEIQEE